LVPLPLKSGSYEQIFYVKGFSVFLFWRFGLFCCSVVVGPQIVLPCFYSYFSEPLGALCWLGSEEEADVASFRTASFRAQADTQSSGRGVVATVARDISSQEIYALEMHWP
jgi:hypothetical protein